ncbi:hypothetical protein [Xaviernesmea rhizosphaerae]
MIITGNGWPRAVTSPTKTVFAWPSVIDDEEIPAIEASMMEPSLDHRNAE